MLAEQQIAEPVSCLEDKTIALQLHLATEMIRRATLELRYTGQPRLPRGDPGGGQYTFGPAGRTDSSVRRVAQGWGARPFPASWSGRNEQAFRAHCYAHTTIVARTINSRSFVGPTDAQTFISITEEAKMPATWTVTNRLTKFLADLIASSDFAAVASGYYPSVMWSSGGWMEGPGRPREPLAPRYEVGLVEQAKLGDFRLAVPNPKFGYIIFSPKPADEASGRRLIDFDGKNIMVR